MSMSFGLKRADLAAGSGAGPTTSRLRATQAGRWSSSTTSSSSSALPQPGRSVSASATANTSTRTGSGAAAATGSGAGTPTKLGSESNAAVGVDDYVRVAGTEKCGIVRFKGPVHFSSGMLGVPAEQD
jgi:hypothetical protein